MIKTSQIFSWLIIAMGLLTLVGWQFGLDLLRNFVPGAIYMNPTTAVCLVLIGFLIQNKSAWLSRLGSILIIFVGVS